MRFFQEDADNTPRARLRSSGGRATMAAVIGMAFALLILGAGIYFMMPA